MTKYAVAPTDCERTFGEDEIIVSKTDTTGRITYANDVFQRVAQFTEDELMGEPHSIVRHPDMPRSVFKLLWDTIEAKQEIFAYVKNMASTGDYYWVFAHVTATTNDEGEIVGYHSMRRSPSRDAVAKIEPIYQQLLDIENSHDNAKDGMTASFGTLVDLLDQNGVTYEEFVFSL